MKSLIVAGMLAASALFIGCDPENNPVAVSDQSLNSESIQGQTVHRSRTEYRGTLWNNCAGVGEYVLFTGTQTKTWVETVLEDGTVRTKETISIRMNGVGAESGVQYTGTQKGEIIFLYPPNGGLYCPYTEDSEMVIKFSAPGTANDGVHNIHTHTTVACDRSRNVEVLEDTWICN